MKELWTIYVECDIKMSINLEKELMKWYPQLKINAPFLYFKCLVDIIITIDYIDPKFTLPQNKRRNLIFFTFLEIYWIVIWNKS